MHLLFAKFYCSIYLILKSTTNPEQVIIQAAGIYVPAQI